MITLTEWLWKFVRILGIAGAVYLFVFVSGIIFRKLLWRRFTPLKGEARRRVDTIVPLLQSLTKYIVTFFAIILILQELGVDARALLAGAGVVGLAIGFGAQTLVRDIVTGIFLLFEDTISVGDTVQIDDLTGVVEEITLRVTRLRLFSGALVTIPNGQITKIANYNRGFTRAVVEVSIAYEADVDRVMEVLREVAETYCQSHQNVVLEPPVFHRIVQLGSSGVTVRIVLKVLPKEHWSVERELLYLIKKAFDREGIEIPYQKQTIYLKET